MTVKVIPFFCTVHPLLRIILGHPRWRRFFPLARKEQIGAAFAELKLLFTIIMPQIGLWCDSTFWVCGRNPMMWPFKCKLSACTYTRCYLFFRFEKVKLWHLVEIFFWLNLAVRRLKEVCLHITYLFLKELVTVSDVFSPRFAVPWEFAFIAGSGMKSLFTGIDSSSHTAVSSAQVIYSFMPFSFFQSVYLFYCHC